MVQAPFSIVGEKAKKFPYICRSSEQTMSLFNQLYQINSFEQSENKVLASVQINPSHPIFEGHFPHQPVTPGVCMMQIIKELGEKFYGSSLQLRSARNVKFMAVINPLEQPNILVELLFDQDEAGLISIKSTTSYTDTVALKFSGVYDKK
jgi:3-hydroxyacyl-[acyl-carrier-protein] dehydratase